MQVSRSYFMSVPLTDMTMQSNLVKVSIQTNLFFIFANTFTKLLYKKKKQARKQFRKSLIEKVQQNIYKNQYYLN